MKSSIIPAALAAAFLVPGAALAQGTGLTMPHERDFWGHVGINVGKSEIDARCVAGLNCDRKDSIWRIYGGGRFNNIFGGEIGYTDFGDFTRGPTETEAQSLDFTLLAGVPFGANKNWAVFGKLGAAYTRAEVSGALPGVSGDEDGWGPRYGIGLQAGLTRNWAIRADWDRTEVKLREGDADIDSITVGAQYTFR